MVSEATRRRFLAVAGIGLAGVAGCGDPAEDGDETEDGEGGGDGDGSGYSLAANRNGAATSG